LIVVTIFLGTFGYIEQYLLFRKEKSTGQFSIYITALMIFASLLKLIFYAIKPFGAPLVLLNIMIVVIGVSISLDS